MCTFQHLRLPIKATGTFLQLIARLNGLYFPFTNEHLCFYYFTFILLHLKADWLGKVCKSLSSYLFPLSNSHVYCSVHSQEAVKVRKCWWILHDPHDLIEENPIGQPQVAVSGALRNRVHFHVLAVVRCTVLTLHHILKQEHLWETDRDDLVWWPKTRKNRHRSRK